MTDCRSPPTRDDYAPGDTVWFTGAGWPANDVLDILLEDEPATHEPHTWTIDVGPDGTFRDSTYVVDVDDIRVTFTLTATSRATGRSLTVTFTDGNIRAASAPSGVQFVLSPRTYTGDGCTGTETVLADVTIGNPPFVIVATAGSMGQPSSAKLIAAATSTLGASFSAWSSSSAFTIVGGDPKVICVEGGAGNFEYLATYDASPDLTISKSTSGTFQIGSVNAAYSFEVSNVGTATAEGTAANRITVTDALPSGLTPPASPFSVNNWDCTVSGQTVTCRLATGQPILPGASRTFSFGVGITIDACPSVTNSASVGGGNEPAGNTGNNGSGNVVTAIQGCDNEPPQIFNFMFDPAYVAVNSPYKIEWRLDDLLSNIADAEYSLDGGASWNDAGLPVDGAFDDKIEDFEVMLTSPSSPTILEICVRGTDAAGNTNPDPESVNPVNPWQCGFLPVYDPTAGFVTGGGWIYSEPGYCTSAYSTVCAEAEGKAHFGFVSRYQKGATTPTGNTEFQFQAGNLNFKSTSYQWLVVQGYTKATYKGYGTINGSGNYKFLLAAYDGQGNGGDGVDKFRIKIWTEDAMGNETVYYDNEMNTDIDQPPSTAIGAGSIVIHVPKNK